MATEDITMHRHGHSDGHRRGYLPDVTTRGGSVSLGRRSSERRWIMRFVPSLVLASTMLTGAVAAQVPDGASPQEQRRVGGDIKPPTMLKNVRPKYPFEALKVGLEGIVIVEATIDPEGRVGHTEVLSGPGPLREAAVAAVKQWRFTPTLLGGVAVSVLMTVTVNFTMPGEKVHLRLDDLVSGLHSKDEEIREAAARRLGSVTSSPHDGKIVKRVTSELQKATEDRSERVRKAAAESLARIQP